MHASFIYKDIKIEKVSSNYSHICDVFEDLSGGYMAPDTYGERFQLQEDEGGFQSFLEIAEISMCGSWWSR